MISNQRGSDNEFAVRPLSSSSPRPTSIIENSFECIACIEVEDMTVFGLESDRNVDKREKAFQITSPLASMELSAGQCLTFATREISEGIQRFCRFAESRADKESWLMSLSDAKYGRLADLQTLQQTATIRQSKRKSLHAVSRRSSSSAFSYAHEPQGILEEGLVLEVEVAGYNSPVVQDATKSASNACAKCHASFTLIKTPQPCLLACGKLFCSECLTRVGIRLEETPFEWRSLTD